MPFSLAAAGSSLQVIFTDGTIQTLTLPSGVFLLSANRPRFAIMNRTLIVVNVASKPLWMDQDGNLRPLPIPKPLKAPTLAAGAAGTLSGTFQVQVAYGVKDELGNVIALGPAGPTSASVTVANQVIDLSSIPLANEPFINFRRVRRTATGPGTEFFDWFDLDDNTTTSFSDGASDASLSLFSAPTDLGAAPARLDLIVEWKGRLFGRSVVEKDNLVYSSPQKFYAWPSTNKLIVQPVGKDLLGITALLPRRDELGIARRDVIWKVVGTGSSTDTRLVKLIEGKGAIAPDSVVVTRDVARWLAEDGVYEWDSEGVRCITDAQVHPWFNTDTYFNRAQFPNAFARYNPLKHAYDLFLCPAGSSSFTRWVSYDIARKCWLGPHLTSAFTPSGAGLIYDANALLVPVVGGTDGYVYSVTPGTYRDGAATAIDFDITGKFHSGNAPDIMHYWGQLSVLTKKEAAGTLVITPKVGGLDAVAGTAINHDMTLERERLRRLGVGRLCQLRLRNNENNQAAEIYGYELPFHEVGRR